MISYLILTILILCKLPESVHQYLVTIQCGVLKATMIGSTAEARTEDQTVLYMCIRAPTWCQIDQKKYSKPIYI